MAASLAHEIRQPITAAMTDARTCMRWLAREQPEIGEARAAADRVVNATTRAAEIIGRVASLYKKGTPQRGPVDVNEVARETIALLTSEARRYSVSLRADLSADLPAVTADRVQVQQVLLNLMVNGIEAMQQAGGELTVKSERRAAELLLSVSDTGVGLPVEKQGAIFDAFFTTKPQGSGMGLTISRTIVQSHGGRLWPMTGKGRGTTFCFTLPTDLVDAKAIAPR
jgi:signal transduction histidine kinase